MRKFFAPPAFLSRRNRQHSSTSAKAQKRKGGRPLWVTAAVQLADSHATMIALQRFREQS